MAKSLVSCFLTHGVQNLWSTCICKIYMSYFCTLQSIYESANNNDETYNDSGVETVQNCKVM